MTEHEPLRLLGCVAALLAAAGVVACLASCSGVPMSTETLIEQGAATLVPETVVVGAGDSAAITAMVLIRGERKPIAVMVSDCNDNLGTIRVLDDLRGRGITEITAFGRGERPADLLFVAMCDYRHKKAAGQPQGSPR
jgi:hypothetical protein